MMSMQESTIALSSHVLRGVLLVALLSMACSENGETADGGNGANAGAAGTGGPAAASGARPGSGGASVTGGTGGTFSGAGATSEGGGSPSAGAESGGAMPLIPVAPASCPTIADGTISVLGKAFVCGQVLRASQGRSSFTGMVRAANRPKPKGG
jgi:hypothetical protein